MPEMKITSYATEAELDAAVNSIAGGDTRGKIDVNAVFRGIEAAPKQMKISLRSIRVNILASYNMKKGGKIYVWNKESKKFEETAEEGIEGVGIGTAAKAALKALKLALAADIIKDLGHGYYEKK